MKKLIIENESWSCNLYPKYKMAIEKAQKFLDDINLDGKLARYIHSGAGVGACCTVHLFFNIKEDNRKLVLCITLNLEKNKHSIDVTTPISELSQQYSNYFSYEKLVETIKEVIISGKYKRLDL